MLSKSEQFYVVKGVSGLFVSLVCEVKIKDGGVSDIADRLGTEDTLRRAVTAALGAQMKVPYQRDDLILPSLGS